MGERGETEAARQARAGLKIPDPATLPLSSPAHQARHSPRHTSSPSTCTRAWASTLPAGVLLTQRYHVPSYTSTLLMRKVPFLETSNRESCNNRRGLGLSPHHHCPGDSTRKEHYGGKHRGEERVGTTPHRNPQQRSLSPPR